MGCLWTPWETAATARAIDLRRAGRDETANRVATKVAGCGIPDEVTFLDVMSASGLTGGGLQIARVRVRAAIAAAEHWDLIAAVSHKLQELRKRGERADGAGHAP